MNLIRLVSQCGALLSAVTLSTASAQLPMEIVEAVATATDGSDTVDSLVGLIQTGSSEDVRQQRALDLSEFIARSFTSVVVNEAQSNPLQPDVRYRGFVASPLLGLPQGIAVYQDGVRINEPFGDTVNWALLPTMAVDAIYLVPGSNPLFGLNSLGGALSIRTKSGLTHPGTRLSAQVGSNSRSEVLAETGRAVGDRTAYYLAGSYLEDDGWRDFSPSRRSSVFARISHTPVDASIDLSLTSVDTNLIGNGAAPVDLLAGNSRAIFTRPDQTRNDLDQLLLDTSRELDNGVVVSAAAYVRRSDIETLNGDDSDFEECEEDPSLICLEEDDESPIFGTNGLPVSTVAALLGATLNRTRTEQDGRGISLQVAYGAGDQTRWLAGVSVDGADIDFSGSTELGSLDATRAAVPGGTVVANSLTSLRARARNAGLYLAYTASPVDTVSLSLSGRYNRSEVTLRDQLGTALNGDHRFSKFNPSAGITWLATEELTLFASVNQSNRAPSPVELTCADKDDPCRLPNAFLSDPPLEQVVAKTAEAGLRGRWRAGRWSATAFRTNTREEILFISAGNLTNQGFFDNVGKTRRHGIEAVLDGELNEHLSWSLSYSWLDATFRTAFIARSPSHPLAGDGEIAVDVGDRLPLIPDRQLKAAVRFSPTPGLWLSGDLQTSSGAYLRGDETNSAAKLSDYTVVNVRASLAITERASVFLKVDNLFDESYATFGLFGDAAEVLGGDFDDPRFLSPGAPRAAWLGIEIEL